MSVTVSDATKLSWHHAPAKCAAPASIADLVPGHLVHKVKVNGGGNGGDAAHATSATPTAKEISLVCTDARPPLRGSRQTAALPPFPQPGPAPGRTRTGERGSPPGAWRLSANPRGLPVRRETPVIARLASGVVPLLLLTMTGCSSRGGDVARVTSTADPAVCWSATIGKATNDGCRSQTFPNVASIDGIFTGIAQKKTPGSGPLTRQLFAGGKAVQTSKTTAPFGTVNAANG